MSEPVPGIKPVDLEAQQDAMSEVRIAVNYMQDFARQLYHGECTVIDYQEVTEVFAGSRDMLARAFMHVKPQLRGIITELMQECTLLEERLARPDTIDQTFLQLRYGNIMELSQDLVVFLPKQEIEFDDGLYETMKKFDIRIGNIYNYMKSFLANLVEGHKLTEEYRTSFQEGIDYLSAKLLMLAEAKEELAINQNPQVQDLASGISEITIPLLEVMVKAGQVVCASERDKELSPGDRRVFNIQLEFIQHYWELFKPLLKAVTINPIYKQYRDVERPKREPDAEANR